MTGQNLLEPIIAAAKASQVIGPDDYRDEEGFLVCGSCKTRRETEIKDLSDPTGQTMVKVPILCECRLKAREEEEARQKKIEWEERLKRLRQLSLMDERLANATFDNFEVRPQNEKCHKLLSSYAKRFDQMVEKSQGLLLYGTVGSGKTYGAACIANYLLDLGVPVIMTSFVKIVDSMRGWSNPDETMVDRLNRAKLLIIDDLGAERDTEFALERVYDIIDSRYRSRLPLILTTNLNVTDMLNENDIRYSRIYDRIFEMCVPIPFSGIEWRKEEASRRFKRMQEYMED